MFAKTTIHYHAWGRLEHDDKLAPWVGLCLEPIEVLQF